MKSPGQEPFYSVQGRGEGVVMQGRSMLLFSQPGEVAAWHIPRTRHSTFFLGTCIMSNGRVLTKKYDDCPHTYLWDLLGA